MAAASPPVPNDSAPNDLQAVQQLAHAYKSMTDQLGKVIVGQSEVIEQVLTAMFCQGHILLVGVPGLAKTLLVRTIADVLQLSFKRVQFTPDLMPSDITGTDVLEEDRTTGKRAFRFVRGPLFANILLADEINRTPPKTQAALLEAMQEHRVTVRRNHLRTPRTLLRPGHPEPHRAGRHLSPARSPARPLHVHDHRPLPLAGRGNPDHETGHQRLQGQRHPHARRPRHPAASRRSSAASPSPNTSSRTPATSCRATRPSEPGVPDYISELVQWGAGPRAGIYLILAGKARAILHGRVHVTTEDIAQVAAPVLRHRILTTFSAEAAGMTSDKIIERLLEQIPRTAAAS